MKSHPRSLPSNWRNYHESLRLDDDTAAMERELQKRIWTARVAGFCIAAVGVGLIVAILWPR